MGKNITTAEQVVCEYLCFLWVHAFTNWVIRYPETSSLFDECKGDLGFCLGQFEQALFTANTNSLTRHNKITNEYINHYSIFRATLNLIFYGGTNNDPMKVVGIIGQWAAKCRREMERSNLSFSTLLTMLKSLDVEKLCLCY